MKLRRIMAAAMAVCIVCGAPAAVGAYQPSYELTANAADILYSGKCGDNATWTLDSEGTLTISGTGDINEESFWNSYKNETGIESYNDLWDSLNRVVVKKGITSLPDNLFAKCANIVSVSLPDSLKSIGSCTFCQCKKLETIKIPESVEYIGSKAFDSTKWLYNKSEESSPVIVNSFLLYGADCSGDVVIPNGVTVISDSAFGWSKITSIEIPNSVTKIEAMAFQGCNELKSIIILNPNCEIEDHPGTIFNDYDEDGTGYIYSGVIKGYSGSTAEAYAKKHNRTFEALTPETPTSTTITTTTTKPTTTTTATETETTSAATTTATADAPSVNDERIVGQWYVYMISWKSEKGATDLLPNDDQYIVNFKNDGTFTLNIKNDTGYSENSGTWSVSGDDLTLIRPDGVSDSAVISNSWTFKGQKWIVVQDNKELYLVRGGKFNAPVTTSATQPATTTAIETTTTESNTTETTTKPATTTAKSTNTPKEVATTASDESKTVSIEKDGYTYYFVFYSDHAVLDHVDIPVDLNEKKNVTLNIPSQADKVPVTAIGNKNNLIHQVHDELVGGDFLGDITIKVPDTVTTINERAFSGIHTLKSVELPDSVKTIGKNAFSSCYGIEEIVLPESVEKIGKEAFSACSHLKSITILNPDCNIFKMAKTISDGFNGEFKGTICGYSGSTAEAYAKLYDRKFKSLGNAPARPSFGDPTGDGIIDAKDSSFVLAEYAELSTGGESKLTEAEQNASDVNKDGLTDSSDASSILDYYAYVSTGGTDTIEAYLGYEKANDELFEAIENPDPEFDGLNYEWPEPSGTMEQRIYYYTLNNFNHLTSVEGDTQYSYYYYYTYYFDAYMHYLDFYHDDKHPWSEKCLSYTNDYGDEIILYPDKNYLRFYGMDFSFDESDYGLDPDNEIAILSNGHDFFKYDWEKLKDICDVIVENAR